MWAAEVGVTDINQVDAQIIRQFLASLQERDLKPTTIRTAGRCLRVWVRFLVADGLLAESPMHGVRLPKAPTPHPDVFTHDELQRLLAAAATMESPERDRAFVLALLDTGCRAREFLLLRRGDLDLDTGKVTIRSENAKTHMQRVVFLGQAARAALVDYLATRQELTLADPLWWGRRGPLTIDGFERAIGRIGSAAGVYPNRPHRYRRTFATWMLHAGVDAKTVAGILGHSVEELLRSYVMSNDETLHAAHAQHGPVDHWLIER